MNSGSLSEPYASAAPGDLERDLFRLTSLRDFDTDRLLVKEFSSTAKEETEVAAVEVERDENFMELSEVVDVVPVRSVRTVLTRDIADFERLWFPIEPLPKESLLLDVPKRFRDITSNPNTCALDR